MKRLLMLFAPCLFTLAFTAYAQIEPLITLPFNEFYLMDVIWSSDSSRFTYLVLNSASETTPILDAETGEEVLSLPVGFDLYGLSWSPDGSYILTVGYDTGVIVWDAETAEQVLELEGATGEWNTDGTQILISDGDYEEPTFTAWDVITGEQVQDFVPVLPNEVLSPDANQKLTWVSNETCTAWTISISELNSDIPLFTLELPRTLNSCDEAFGIINSFDAGWNITGNQILIAAPDTDGIAYILDGESGEQIFTIEGYNAIWNPTGNQILAYDSLSARVWDAETQELLFTLSYADGGAVWSPAGDRIVTWASTGRANLWDAATGDLLVSLPHQLTPFAGGDGFHAPWFSPDGSRIATTLDGIAGYALSVGGIAEVFVYDDGLKMRSEPGTSFDIVETLPSGTLVEILDGPIEAEGYIWWLVRSPSGNQGWSVEGADAVQTLIPSALAPVLQVWDVP